MNSSGNIEMLKKQNMINQSLVFKMNKQNKYKIISSLNSSNINIQKDIPIMYNPGTFKVDGAPRNKAGYIKN